MVRDSGGYAVALAWTMPNVYDVGPGETMFTASDVGWVVGHSYIVYAPLLAGATTVLYEGKPVGTPDAGQFWRVVAEHGVKSLFTAPTAFRAIKKEDPQRRTARPVRPVRACEYLFLAGERLDPETYHWADGPARHPGDRPLVADRDRLADRRQPGRHRAAADQARLADPADARLGRAGARHRTASRSPTGDGRRDRRQAADAARRRCRRCGTTTSASSRSYLSAFDGYYLTGDGGHIDDDGYLFVMGRTDDVINVAGHRLSTGGMEEVLAVAPGRRRVRGHRRGRRDQGPGAARVRRAEGRRATAPTRTSCAPSWCSSSASQIGAVASLREVARRGGAAEDPVGQDPAQDDARHRRRRRRAGAVHDRGRRRAGRLRPVLRRPDAQSRRSHTASRRVSTTANSDSVRHPGLGRSAQLRTERVTRHSTRSDG